VLLTAERRRHRHRGAGLRHGPTQDPGGDSRGPAGSEKGQLEERGEGGGGGAGGGGGGGGEEGEEGGGFRLF